MHTQHGNGVLFEENVISRSLFQNIMEVVERMKGKRVVKPIVYGNTATPFGYKRESDQHTHQWTVFLKMFNDDDPSDFIRKVQFKLHDSYAVNTRVCDKPPYEVTETGWGEFEVQMRIYFVDVNEKPVTVFHYLRLFQPVFTLPNGTTQVIAEHYDEITEEYTAAAERVDGSVDIYFDRTFPLLQVFQEPTIPMYKALTAGDGKKHDRKKFHADCKFFLFLFLFPHNLNISSLNVIARKEKKE
ncbi:YEATS family protein [Ancylostoma duodenale]|uniref:YEATS family protein n=2 Tax=Strongyloidea TaxID=27829 RepID=A0A0C2FBG2_9BILA|nr:YEATS family protein [Ancylostoma duodenale]